jgi:alcohol dehydrogenase
VIGPISPFVNHLPVQISFGEGRAQDLPATIRDLGAEPVLVLLDEGLQTYNPAVKSTIESVVSSGLSVTLIEKEPGEPTISMVDKATAHLHDVGARALVALGGGSVMDTAKAARLCHQLGCTFVEFLASARAFPAPDIPLVAVPTTAGTGSEVSGGAVISDPDAGRKAGIAHPNLRAQAAIVDPCLTWSMPPAMTANTGIDALAQAIAATIAKVHTPIGDAIAFEAVRLIAPALPRAFADGGDHDARSAMACGALMAGLAMNISDCTAEHSLGQAIGGLTRAPHGLTVGLVLAETLDRERLYVADRLERVAQAWGLPDGADRDGSRLVAAVRQLLEELSFPALSTLGLGHDDLDTLTDAAMSDYFLTMSPHPWAREEVRAAFATALERPSYAHTAP